ncbi:hypothetical protein [uncultured Roseovarius sp.]|uniref:hypothetical protein n=1 Tax=uncultured Roseovarius sp. TaxID=293344 RepID=UPI0026155B5C|nr:hypothetical protein [uncultured Roseovarius sp.]
MFRVLLLLLVLGFQAQAGPWPRGDGKVFLSFHGNAEASRDLLDIRQYATIYGEYGLTDTITLGVDYSGSELGTDKAIAFVRIPIANGDRQLRFSAELGIGLVDGENALRPGVSVGRGVSMRGRHGWITLDTRLVLPGGEANQRLEADFTFGLSISKRFKAILQLQGGMPSEGDRYLKFAPSVVFERKPGKYFELGVVTGIQNYDAYGVKFGIWKEF